MRAKSAAEIAVQVLLLNGYFWCDTVIFLRLILFIALFVSASREAKHCGSKERKTTEQSLDLLLGKPCLLHLGVCGTCSGPYIQ